jgi:Tol biopolymer transport system component
VIGKTIGPYQILGELGRGGMGEVYRATDTKLDRAVAIKVLPEALARDADRVARFTREARTLAALNHPNIAQVFGVEEQGTTRALVMELVEGDDLAQIISRGPIAWADALPIAKQIAEALEAAHEQGIIHRDLKPANIKVRADGMVKVLDFGLAKALDPAGTSNADAMNSPTLTSPAMTAMGVILGTAAYMAPEQARGKSVDKRADVWAFGCVLYEMLTGERAFKGEDISVTLASVIKDDVNLQAPPAGVPAPVRHLLRRCLEKDPRRRLRDIGEARLLLEDPASVVPASGADGAARASSTGAVRPLWRRAMPLAATALGVCAIAGVLFWIFQPPPPPDPIVTRFPIVLPADQVITRPNSVAIAVSPDGKRIVYVANRQLYLREMADAQARPIPGTGVDPAGPFFSPDGQWVVFVSVRDSLLQKIAITGGSLVTLCKVEAMFGASWAGDGIVFATSSGIMRVSENGGEPEALVKISEGETAFGPQMLDESRLIFTLANGAALSRWDTAQIVSQSLTTGERRVLVRGGSHARFVRTALSSASGADPRRGHLVYAVGNALRAVPFDLVRLEVLGTAAPVVDEVARVQNPALMSGVAQYDVSATGMLAYVQGFSTDASEPKSLAFVGLDGKARPIAVPALPYIHPRLSPDGRRLAVATDDGKNADVWVYDLVAGGALRRLTFGGRNLFPIWTRDSRFVTYQSDRESDWAVFRQLADGSGPAERLTKPEAGVRHEPESWSADGKTLTVNLLRGGNQGIWLFPVNPQGAPQALVDTESTEKHSTFSPDGRWLAYMATGRASGGSTEVFIQPFPLTGAKYLVSTSGPGRTPAWSSDGKRLFFHSPASNQLLMVDIRAEQGLTFSAAAALPIEGTIHPTQQRNYDVTADGKQLVVVLPVPDAKKAEARDASQQINVVLNWFEELRTRARSK